MVCELDANTHEIILRVQVANFHHRYGGFWQSIQLGPTQTLTQTHDRLVAIELLLAGCLLIMSLYHLGVYMFRQQDRSALYFSLVSLLFVVHTLITNERYLLQIFPQLPWAVSFRAEYLAMYLGFPYYIMFFHSVYPQEFSGKVREGVRIVGFGLSALVVLLPTYIFSYTTETMQVVMAGIGLYVLYVLIKAVRRGRETSKIFLLGFLFFAASLVNDSLYANHWIETGKWASFGFLIFTISQSIVLSIRFARSFSAIEEMSHDLEQRVQKRTEEISRQYQELERQKSEIIRQNQIIEKKNQNITASITYASRIQKAIIGNEDAITSNFKESFILIKPKDIVSGDFYWFTEVKRSGSIKGGDDRQTIFFKIIAAADCTGHGIPGAFMTVMGNALLDEIINENKVTNPSRILSVLDRKLLMKLQQHNVNDGMDMALLVFDDENQRVSFSGANNPLYYVREGQIYQVKGSKFPIGSAQYRQKKKFDLHHVDYLPGDVYYIFSDGFQDQFGGELGQKYYKKRFREFLLAISHLPLREQKKHLEDELRQWQGEHPQTDDILIIGIRT
ncbi:MAG: SpoIIE family protein phosphatase [Microscillaceae bacterium]|nr:SpoIIE family protein phosphatase [Microscillaceae bacterium]